MPTKDMNKRVTIGDRCGCMMTDSWIKILTVERGNRISSRISSKSLVVLGGDVNTNYEISFLLVQHLRGWRIQLNF